MKTTRIAIDRLQVRVQGPRTLAGRSLGAAVGQQLLEQLAANRDLRDRAGDVRLGSVDAGMAAETSGGAVASRLAEAVAERIRR